MRVCIYVSLFDSFVCMYAGGQDPVWDLKEELRRINEQEILEIDNMHRAKAMPTASEAQSIYEREMDRMGRLRKVRIVYLVVGDIFSCIAVCGEIVSADP